MRISKMLSKKYIILIPLLFIIAFHSISQTTAENCINPTSKLHNNYGLLQLEFPKLLINNAIINDGDLLEEGKTININFQISNEDDINYPGLELVVEIAKNLLVQHGPKPEPSLYNKSLNVIPSLSTISEQISFIGKFGQFTLTASLVSNGTVLPNSVYLTTFQVISQPIGSVVTLLLTTLSIIIFLLALIPIPLMFQKLKSNDIN